MHDFMEHRLRSARQGYGTFRGYQKEYPGDREDRRSAFKIAASLQDCTPQRALVGMMAKHIVSLYDMCYSKNTTFTKQLWDEKITDSLNYLFLLAAIIREEGTHEQN